MRIVRVAAALLSVAFSLSAAALGQVNHTTSVTLANVLVNGSSLPYGRICAVAGDQYGSPLTFSAVGWGVVSANNAFCANVVNGALSGTLNVPDANQTNRATPITYTFSIQVTNSSFVAQSPAVVLFATVPGVAGATFSLDNYTPSASAIAFPASNLIGAGSSVPTSCTSPSIWIVPGTPPTLYTCSGGIYQVASTTAVSVTYGTSAGTAAQGNDPRIVAALKNQGAYSSGTSYSANDVVTTGSGLSTQFYVSILPGLGTNQGNAPATSPADWQLLGGMASGATVAGANVLQASDPTGTLLQAATPQVVQSAINASLYPALTAWRAAAHNVANAPVSVVILGDSTLAGIGPGTLSNSAPYQLAALLGNKFAANGTGIIPLGYNGGTALRPEWTMSGTPVTEADFGPSQTGTGAFSSTFTLVGSQVATLQSTPGQIALIEGESAAGDTGCQVSSDGAVLGTVGAYTSGPSAAFYSTLTTTLGNHVLTITAASSGSCHLYGAGWALSSASSGLQVFNFSHGYARSEAFGTAPATQMAYVAALPVAPSLAIVGLGVNDIINGTGVTQAQYSARMQAILTELLAINPQMSILILDEHNTSATGTVLTKAMVQSTELSLATTNNLAYMSMAAVEGTEANAAANGLMAGDGTHDSDKGGIFTASVLYDKLVENTNPQSSSTFSGQISPLIYLYKQVGGASYTELPSDPYVAFGGSVITLPTSPVSGETHTIFNSGSSNITFTNTIGTIAGYVLAPGNSVTVTYASSGYWNITGTTFLNASNQTWGPATLSTTSDSNNSTYNLANLQPSATKLGPLNLAFGKGTNYPVGSGLMLSTTSYSTFTNVYGHIINNGPTTAQGFGFFPNGSAPTPANITWNFLVSASNAYLGVPLIYAGAGAGSYLKADGTGVGGLFGGSGSGHSQGLVPDPGATAGSTRFLREDGSWNVPAGTGGSGSGTVTSFGFGTTPAWLTFTVTNPTTTPSVAVAATLAGAGTGKPCASPTAAGTAGDALIFDSTGLCPADSGRPPVALGTAQYQVPAMNSGLTAYVPTTLTPTIVGADAAGAASAALQTNAAIYALDTGTASAYAVTLTPTPTVGAGSEVLVKLANTSTGASTLSVNGSAAAIRKKTASGLLPIAAGDLVAGNFYRFNYDGTYWQTSASASTASGTITSVGAGGSSSPNVAVSVSNPTTTPAISVVSYSGGPGTISPFDTRQHATQVVEISGGSAYSQVLYSDGVAWSSTPNYALGAKVTYSSACYQSISSGPGGNINHAPSSSPTYWSAYTCPTTTGATVTAIQLATLAVQGASGTCSIAAATTAAPPTMTCTAVTNTILPLMSISGTGVTSSQVVQQLSGTTGGVGTYQISASQTVSSETITFTPNVASYMSSPLTIIVDGVTHNTTLQQFYNLGNGCVTGGFNNPSSNVAGAGNAGNNLIYNASFTNCTTTPTGVQFGATRRIWMPYYASLEILYSPVSFQDVYSQVESLNGVAAAGIYPPNYAYFNMFDYTQNDVGAYQTITPLAAATVVGGGYIDSWFDQWQQKEPNPARFEGNITVTVDGAVQQQSGGTEDFFCGQFYNFGGNSPECGAQEENLNTQMFVQEASTFKYWHASPFPYTSSFSFSYPNGQVLQGIGTGPINAEDEFVWYSASPQTGATNNTPVTWPATSPTHTWGDATAATACTSGSTWTDTVGSANFTTNTGSPSCTANTINGHTALVLASGTADSMIASAFNSSCGTNSAPSTSCAFPKTFLFVFQPSSACATNDQVFLGSAAGAGGGTNYSSLLCDHATGDWGFNAAYTDASSSTTFASGTPVCGEIVVDAMSSRISINGVVSTFWNNNTSGGGLFGPGLVLGKNGGSAAAMYGAWGWLSVYDGNASASQVATTMSSVCSAWGINNAGAW